MKYHNITYDDMNNGDGLRVVLWLSGCSHRCDGCQNPITWNPDSGLDFDQSAKYEIFEQLKQDYISGITFSGGDPLFINSRKAVTEFAKEIKEKFPNKTIWMYTGYLWEDIKDLDVIRLVDVLVDGKFVRELNDNTLKWRGSSNQRVIDAAKSIAEGKVILHCD